MRRRSAWIGIAAVMLLVLWFAAVAGAQTESGTVSGTVKDPSGAVVPNAIVTIENPVSGFEQAIKTDANGRFRIPNVPFSPYHVTVTATGFAPHVQDVEVQSVVPLSLAVHLKVASAASSVMCCRSGLSS